MPEKIYQPVKVKIKLKKICCIDLNKWYCTILDEPRVVTQEIVEYVCQDIDIAAKSFKKTEVEYAIISAHYGRE